MTYGGNDTLQPPFFAVSIVKRLLPVALFVMTFMVLPAGVCAGEGTTTVRAVSLKVLRDSAQSCATEAAGVSACADDVGSVAGLKKVLGYVIDETLHDIVLFGEFQKQEEPPLLMDDLVVALRNNWLEYAEKKGGKFYYTAPGCSIDPPREVFVELQGLAAEIFSAGSSDAVGQSITRWDATCKKPQDVKVLGIPYDTHFGQVMVGADYFMKKLVDGSVPLDVDGVDSLIDMTLRVASDDITAGRPVSIPLQTVNRFWFAPGGHTFVEDDGIVLIKKSGIVLLAEEKFFSKEAVAAEPDGLNPLAERFARSFTANYNAIADKQPLYKELRSLFRFMTLAKLFRVKRTFNEAGLGNRYLVKEYPVGAMPVERTLPGVARVKEFKKEIMTDKGISRVFLWLPTCGGVNMNILITSKDFIADTSGDLRKLKAAILAGRPSPDALSWDVETDVTILETVE